MSAGFSFIHAADLHLDSPFCGYSNIDCEEDVRESVLKQLRDCTFTALENIVSACIENRVDFLVLAGDIYDQADRSLRAQLRLREAFERLAGAGISVYVAYGNHDHNEGFQARLNWPENVHFFAPGQLESRPVIRGNREIARIYGISYPQRDVTQNYATGFKRDLEAPFAIAVLHCNVGGNTLHANYAPCSLSDLEAGGFDYWALGHVHRCLTLKEHGPCVVYPGNPQGRGPHETGAKGCCLVRVDESGLINLSFVETDSVRWVSERVSIEGISTEQELLERLDAGLAALGRAHGGRSLVVRLKLAGRGVLHHRLKKPGSLEGMLEEMRRRYTMPEGSFIWTDSIICATAPEVDKASLIGSQTLLGDLLSISGEARRSGQVRAGLLEALAPLNERIARHIEFPQGEYFDELLEAAEDLALDLLWEEDAR